MIDALGVIQVGVEHALAFHVGAVLKVGRVPIEADIGSLVIGQHGGVDTAQVEQIEATHGINVAASVVSIEAKTRAAIVESDVLWHLECRTEPTILHLNTTLV